MENKRVYFFMQYNSMGSSSRGIRSGGVVLSMDDLLDKEYYNTCKHGSCSLLYQVGRSELCSIKSMRLEEFEELFVKTNKLDKMNHLLGFDGRQSVFRKEIEEKYGALAQKPKASTTSKYEVGDVIETSGGEYIYCGKMSVTIRVYGKQYRSEMNEHTYSGHLYVPTYGKPVENTEEVFKNFMQRITRGFNQFDKYFLKGKRKTIVGTDFVNIGGISETGEMKHEVGKSYLYNYERIQEVSWKPAD